MLAVQSTDALLEVSENGGVTWKTVVCLENWDVTIQSSTTETVTACGIAIGVGPIKFGAKGTAVMDAGYNPATQATLKNFVNWQNQKEVILFRVIDPGSASGSAGFNITIGGTCLVSNSSMKMKADDVIHFDFELLGTGAVEINYPVV